MFMSNKCSVVKTDAKAASASGLPRNEKSDVRADIKKAAALVKGKGKPKKK